MVLTCIVGHIGNGMEEPRVQWEACEPNHKMQKEGMVECIALTHWLMPCPQYVLTTLKPLFWAVRWIADPTSRYLTPGETNHTIRHTNSKSQEAKRLQLCPKTHPSWFRPSYTHKLSAQASDCVRPLSPQTGSRWGRYGNRHDTHWCPLRGK